MNDTPQKPQPHEWWASDSSDGSMKDYGPDDPSPPSNATQGDPGASQPASAQHEPTALDRSICAAHKADSAANGNTAPLTRLQYTLAHARAAEIWLAIHEAQHMWGGGSI